VIKLSNMLLAIALGKERPCNVHCTQVELLIGGMQRRQRKQRWGRSRGRGRTKGSQRIVRWWCVKRMSCKGGATRSDVTTDQRIERWQRAERMSGKGGAMRSDTITSQRIESWQCIKRMGGKGGTLSGRDVPQDKRRRWRNERQCHN
jgi:hypothetical protein